MDRVWFARCGNRFLSLWISFAVPSNARVDEARDFHPVGDEEETRRQGGMEAPHSSEHRGILLLSRVLIDPDDKETLQKNGP